MDQSPAVINNATVFIIDDDEIALKSLTALISSMRIDYACFGSAEEFLDSYSHSDSGCIVTDLRMLGMSGAELQQKLAEMGSALPVIIITAYASIPVAVESLQSGVFTFLEKSCSEDELWQAIKDAFIQNKDRMTEKHKRDSIEKIIAILTNEEQKILELIAEGNSNKQIAYTLDMGLRTVENRRHQIMHKVGVKSLAELMKFFIQAKRIEAGNLQADSRQR
ncbi:MAG: DNA-binding response regulator [Blastopirellula sp.]|nr:MAG: DNA-binding response regulator [Blastopirellula sp.]